MEGQSLDQGEILSVRWAHDDPNPVAQDAINRADKDALAALMTAKGISLEQAPLEYPVNYQLPPAKRSRNENGDELTSLYPAIAYPDTDAQYSVQPQMTQEEYAAYYAAYYANSTNLSSIETSNNEEGKDKLDTIDSRDKDTSVTNNSKTNQTNNDTQTSHVSYSGDDEGEWIEAVDDSTGATYYFNTGTGESSWEPPKGFEKK
jgi:hypothetical protein